MDIGSVDVLTDPFVQEKTHTSVSSKTSKANAKKMIEVVLTGFDTHK